MNQWKISRLPEDRYVICISSMFDAYTDWIFVGKKDPKFEDDARTKNGIGISWVKYWHELPESPEKDGDEWLLTSDWIRCDKFPAPSLPYDSLEFLLFDEELGIVQAEYWGGYQTDVVSCKYGYKKPLFWMPFPLLPLPSRNVLQM